MSRVLLVAPCGEIQETNSSKKKGFREEALFSCMGDLKLFHDGHFVDQVLGAAQFFNDEQRVANIQADGALYLG